MRTLSRCSSSLVLALAAGLTACTDTGPIDEGVALQGLNAAADLDQCANGPLAAPEPCQWKADWVNGNLNESKSHYFEGDSVPYRMRFANLTTGASSTVVIEWDTSEGEHHALDYLTTWNRTVSAGIVPPAQDLNDPCAGVLGCLPHVFDSFPVPLDPIVAKGPDDLAGTADDITQAPGEFRLFGGDITGVSAYTVAGTYPSTTQTRLAITFTPTVMNPVLAWGGHISLRADWRPELTATHIPGSPFHMRLISLDGQGGNQDRSLAATAVYNYPSLIVIKHVVNDGVGTKVAGDFTMRVSGPTPSLPSFPGAEAGTIVDLGGEGTYAVTEDLVAGYTPSYAADCTGTIYYDETRTCTITNTDDVVCDPATCDDGNPCTVDRCGANDRCENVPGNAGTVCRESAGVCDVAEACTGTEAACPADAFKPSSEVCNAASGACDVAETCTGSSAACPADEAAAAGTLCRDATDVCDSREVCDGTSKACPEDAFVASTFVCRAATGVCDLPETCTGSSAACPADLVASTATVCRPGEGVCDVAETCDGTTKACPADLVASTATVCRPGADVCDVAETCDGTAKACPANSYVAAGTTCRGADGACDVAEACTGASAACPGDAIAAAGSTCRPQDGVCDVAEACTGESKACPADGFAGIHVTCREADGICDLAEQCTGASGACPADAVAAADVICREADGVCDVEETCTGSAKACPTDLFAASTVTCRDSAGICDVAETCTGSAAACPADAFQPASVQCRADGGDCDVAEFCTGGGAACPADAFEPATVTCRDSAGICDVAEQCTGSGAACPGDAFVAAGTECRGVAGVCDIAEACTGSAALCPGDAFQAATVTCREAGGICDVDETCTGLGAACPADALVAAGTECRASGGVCDLAELCSGSDVTCPEDAKVAAGTLCRGAAGVCDLPEACDGASDACAPDVFVAFGTACRPSTNACDPAEACTGAAADCPVDDDADCELCGQKYYDANASGVNEEHAELGIAGWMIELVGDAATRYATTVEGGGYEFTNLPAGEYVLCERYPLQGNWLQTGPADDCYAVTLPSEVADSCELDFGNLCLGAGGGRTLGYWSNKNGQADFNTLPTALDVLAGLNLVNQKGVVFDPASYKQLRPWMLDGTATNMAYMLSVQLAVMELNIMYGYVDEDQLVYMPGLEDEDLVTLPGYVSVYDLVTKANTALGNVMVDGRAAIYAGSPERAYLETLKTALDRANNNRNFVQPGACAATFPTIAMH